MKKYVDYTLLNPTATLKDFEKLCEEARKYPDIVRSVCVLPDPVIIKFCVKELAGSGIFVAVVNDFPLGRGGRKSKQEGALIAKKAGAQEIDTVMNIGAFREGNFEKILGELEAVTSIFPRRTKVIIETGHEFYKEYAQGKIKLATKLVVASGAFCVKTSTGFIKNIPVEDKVQQVKWMHEAAPELVKKVAGGVKTMAQAKLFMGILPADKLIFGASGKFWLKD